MIFSCYSAMHGNKRQRVQLDDYSHRPLLSNPGPGVSDQKDETIRLLNQKIQTMQANHNMIVGQKDKKVHELQNRIERRHEYISSLMSQALDAGVVVSSNWLDFTKNWRISHGKDPSKFYDKTPGRGGPSRSASSSSLNSTRLNTEHNEVQGLQEKLKKLKEELTQLTDQNQVLNDRAVEAERQRNELQKAIGDGERAKRKLDETKRKLNESKGQNEQTLKINHTISNQLINNQARNMKMRDEIQSQKDSMSKFLGVLRQMKSDVGELNSDIKKYTEQGFTEIRNGREKVSGVLDKLRNEIVEGQRVSACSSGESVIACVSHETQPESHAMIRRLEERQKQCHQVIGSLIMQSSTSKISINLSPNEVIAGLSQTNDILRMNVTKLEVELKKDARSKKSDL